MVQAGSDEFALTLHELTPRFNVPLNRLRRVALEHGFQVRYHRRAKLLQTIPAFQ